MTVRAGQVAAGRLHTFHELEFQEGDMALDTMRILDGQPLYPDPGGNFIPLLYAPLMHYAAAACMQLRGVRDLCAGRLVSIAATAGCLGLIALWVIRATGSVAAGLFAAGFFAGTDPLVGWWFDLYRVDMLCMFFTGLGAFLYLDRPGRREILRGILAGTAMALACMAKQTALALAGLFPVLALALSPVRAIWGTSAFLTAIALFVIRELMISPYFLYYTVTVQLGCPMNLENWPARLGEEFLYPAALALVVILLSTWGWRRNWQRLVGLPALAGALLISFRCVLKMGGYVNHYVTGWFFVAVYVGLALGDLAGSLLAPVLAVILGLSLIHQTHATQDPVGAHFPRGMEKARAYIEAIGKLDGDVWVMHANYYAYLAGRRPEIGIDNVRDLTISGDPVSPYALHLLQSRQYKYLLVNNTNLDADWLNGEIRDAIRANYKPEADWEQRFGWEALRPVDRSAQKPRQLWIRK
jgi:hypothetical protein